MKVFEFVTGLVKPVTDLVDEIFTSEEEKNEFKLQIKKIEEQQLDKALDYHKTLMNQQASVIQGEVSGNALQRSWRPILMLAFGFLVVYQYFIAHLLRLKWPDMPEVEAPDQFWTLMEIGIGGYVAGRSLEKIVPKIVQSNKDKKGAEKEIEVLSEKVKELSQDDLESKDLKKLARLKKREERFLRGQKRREKRRRERTSN